MRKVKTVGVNLLHWYIPTEKKNSIIISTRTLFLLDMDKLQLINITRIYEPLK